MHHAYTCTPHGIIYLTANKNVLSIYDKPIAIVYARYNRSSMLVLFFYCCVMYSGVECFSVLLL